MDFDRILASAPINRTAASVVSQRRGVVSATDMGADEIKPLIQRLARKQRLLKRVLGITSKAMHTNLIHCITKISKTGRGGPGIARLKANPRTALEYKRVGEEMQRLESRLCELRKQRRAGAEGAR